MKFTAFPVKEGDAFLLEYEDQKILVDTGRDEKECGNLLLNDGIRHLSLVVVTHYDKDHVGGLSGILKSDIVIDEIWMPSDLKSVSDYKLKKLPEDSQDQNEDSLSLRNSIKEQLEENDNVMNDEVLVRVKLPSRIIHSSGRHSGRHAVFRQYWENVCKDCNHTCRDFRYCFFDFCDFPYCFRHFRHESDILKCIKQYKICLDRLEDFVQNHHLIQYKIKDYHPLQMRDCGNDTEITYVKEKQLSNITDIVQMAEESNVPIKWLGFTGELGQVAINDNISLLGLNCRVEFPKTIEKQRNEDSPLHGDFVLALTRINKESLVFLFNDKEHDTNILFSSDSGFSFARDTIELGKKSIITAPHHGSGDKENVSAYSKIKSIDPIFVRSDSKNKYRPCSTYIGLQGKKYCTICNTMSGHQKICLKYVDEEWKVHENTMRECQCEVKEVITTSN